MNNESSKQGFYREWKTKQLGKKGYAALEKRGRSIYPYGEYEKKMIFENLKKFGLTKSPYEF